MTPIDHRSAFEPGDDDRIDGHTLDELSDYLASGRQPVDPGIENSASCRLYLAALTRLRNRSWDALATEALAEPDRDETWITGLLDLIKSEVRSGRDIPIRDSDPSTRLTLTEAAVHGIIRSAADTLDDVILGRTTLVGDVTLQGESISVELTAAARYGSNLTGLANTLRDRVGGVLRQHTELQITSITVTIDDVYTARSAPR